MTASDLRSIAEHASHFVVEDSQGDFFDWCALHRFGIEGWPKEAAEQLRIRLRVAYEAGRQSQEAQHRAEQAVLVEALTHLKTMIADWARDEGFPVENSGCYHVVCKALQSAPEAAVKMLAIVEAAKYGVEHAVVAGVFAFLPLRRALSALTDTKDTSDGK
jgi:hypothetical protein